MYRTQAMVQAILEAGEPKNASGTSEAFKKFLCAAFPSTTKAQAEQDVKMQEALKKWTGLGTIEFKTVQASPLQQTAAARRRGDQYVADLKQRASKSRRLA